MEEIPYFYSSPEDEDNNDEDEDTSSRKRRRSTEIILGNRKDGEKKQKASLDIGRSLFERTKDQDNSSHEKEEEHQVDAFFDDTRRETEVSASEPENNKESEALNPAELSAEEIVYVNQTIANDHLEHPVTEDEPEQTVTDFLEKVVDGSDPEDAYGSTVSENELVINGDLNEIETSHINEGRIVLNEAAKPIAYTRVAVTNENRPNNNRSFTASENIKQPERSAKNISLSEEIAKRVVKKQADKSAQNRLKARRKQLEQQVYKMEDSLSIQEQTLQRLTKENRVRLRQIEPVEKTVSSKVESRLNLTKPDRLEQIGKVIISSETPVASMSLTRERSIVNEKQAIREKAIRPNNLRQYFRPEEVKTMRREDLLIVSEKIVVEGANLKDMYDNNLFSERALRRLVAEYLKGKDIRPLLRKEIVEKEMDYERDPVLRDRDHGELYEQKKQPSLFDKMLASAESPSIGGNSTVAKIHKKAKEFKPSAIPASKQPAKTISRSFLLNGILLISIIALLILSIYLLLHKF